MDLENIVVDITQRNYNTIQTIQYDVDSRYVNVKIVNNGKNVDLTNYMVSIACKKPDGKIVFNETEMVEPKQGLINFLISEQISSTLGEIVCELKIYGKNSSVLTTQYFTINVVQPIANKAIQSTNEFRQLTIAMNDYNSWASKIEDKYDWLEEEYAKELWSAKKGINEANDRLATIGTDLKLVNSNYDSVSSKVNSLVDGSPKGVYDNLEALKSAKPNGDIGIYITLNDGKWNYWNGASWVSGGTYQSTGIGDSTITENMVAFPVVGAIRTNNLFNKARAERGKYINEAGSCVSIIDGSDRYASEFIPVVGSTLYTTSDEITHYAFYTDAKAFISQSPVGTKAFTTPANARYVRLTVHSTLVDYLSLEMGNKANRGTPYYQATIGDNFITDNMIAERYLKCSRSSNLFNKETATPNKYIRWNDGALATPIVGGDYYASDYIVVKPSTKYTVKHQSQSAFYDENYRYISGFDSGQPSTFTSPSNARYFRMTINSTANVESQIMVEGETLPQYQEYYMPDIPINSVGYDMLTSELKSLVDGTTQSGLKINFIGDSITWGYESGTGSRVSKPYPDTVAELLRCSVNNYGISGSTIAGDGSSKGYLPIWKRYTEMSKDVTLIVVFAGTNDFGSDRQIELGNFGDTNANTSFYGGLDTLCKGLIKDFPNARIVLLTPMQRGSESANNYGKKLIEYVDAVINVGAKYSIPVVDLYRQGNMPLLVDSFRNQFAIDGLHPNQQGYNRLGEIIANRIKNL